KHNYLVMKLEELPQVMAEAFYVAKSGRPGPVLVDISKDVQQKSMEYTPVTGVQMPAYRAVKPMPKQAIPSLLQAAADLINHAKRPVILAGQGIKHGGAHGELC